MAKTKAQSYSSISLSEDVSSHTFLGETIVYFAQRKIADAAFRHLNEKIEGGYINKGQEDVFYFGAAPHLPQDPKRAKLYYEKLFAEAMKKHSAAKEAHQASGGKEPDPGNNAPMVTIALAKSGIITTCRYQDEMAALFIVKKSGEIEIIKLGDCDVREGVKFNKLSETSEPMMLLGRNFGMPKWEREECQGFWKMSDQAYARYQREASQPFISQCDLRDLGLEAGDRCVLVAYSDGIHFGAKQIIESMQKDIAAKTDQAQIRHSKKVLKPFLKDQREFEKILKSCAGDMTALFEGIMRYNDRKSYYDNQTLVMAEFDPSEIRDNIILAVADGPGSRDIAEFAIKTVAELCQLPLHEMGRSSEPLRRSA